MRNALDRSYRDHHLKEKPQIAIIVNPQINTGLCHYVISVSTTSVVGNNKRELKVMKSFKKNLSSNRSNCRKMKDKEYHVANFATFISKLIFFPPKKWMNLISNQLSTASIKYLNWPSPVFGWFQNGFSKVVIEPRVVQFWSEIILVISNHAYDFSPNCTPLSSSTIINSFCVRVTKTQIYFEVFSYTYFTQLFFVYYCSG